MLFRLLLPKNTCLMGIFYSFRLQSYKYFLYLHSVTLLKN